MTRGEGESPSIRDAELRAILPSIPAGVATTLLVVVAALPYLHSTWSEPHRGPILVVLVLAVCAAVPLLFLPMDRLLAAPRARGAFYLSWTAVDVGLIVTVAILDGGITSPFTILLFLTQAFAAVFYPPRLFLIAATMGLAGLATIATLGGAIETTALLFEAAALIGTSLLCGWAAINAASQRRELARVSRTDPLTGCLNRLGIEERIENEVDRGGRTGGSFALVFVDLDDFKRVNDQLGHAAGDRLLRAIVAAMADVTRGMDALGRLGGDEFALVFPEAKCAGLPVLLERVRRAVSELAPCSLGGVCYPDHGESAAEIIAGADREMYRNKREVPAAPVAERSLVLRNA
jgi:diguanylate cyclase (GGDEF)-like protein